MNDNAPRVLPLPWYDAQDYITIRTVMTDGASLPARYVDWRLSAEQIEGEAKRVGFSVVRVTIDPEVFLALCTQQDRQPDGAARRQFAQEQGRTAGL